MNSYDPITTLLLLHANTSKLQIHQETSTQSKRTFIPKGQTPLKFSYVDTSRKDNNKMEGGG